MRPSSVRRTSTIKPEPVSPRSLGSSYGPGTCRAEDDTPALTKLKELGFNPSLIKTVKKQGKDPVCRGGNAYIYLGRIDKDDRMFAVKMVPPPATGQKLDEVRYLFKPKLSI